MPTPTSLNKKSSYFSLTSKISFLRERRTRTSQGLEQQTQKQPPQLRERQSANARKLLKEPYYSDALCDASMAKTSICETTELTSTVTVSSASLSEVLHCDESITVAHVHSRIGHHNSSTCKPSLPKEEQLRLYKLQLGGARRQRHGHFVGVSVDVDDEVYDDSEDEVYDNSEDKVYDDSDDEVHDDSEDEDYEEQLRQYKLQLGGLRRQRNDHYEGDHDHTENKVYDNAEDEGFMTIQKNVIITIPDAICIKNAANMSAR